MPKITTRSISSPAVHTKKYENIKGVDYSTDPTQIDDNHMADALNLISDTDGSPVRRLGWRIIDTIASPINGIYSNVDSDGVETRFVHGGNNLYTFTDTEATAIYYDMNNAKSVAFSHNGNLYILDGANYLVYDGYSVMPVEGFIPTTTINIASTQSTAGISPVSLEAVNLAQAKRTNTLIGDGTYKSFQLDTTYIDNAAVLCTIAGVEKLEGTDFTINRATGVITFTNAPAAATNDIPNVVVTFSKSVPANYGIIEKCTIVTRYGAYNDNRFFFSGNPDHPNKDWQSGLDDPTYFPDIGYTKVGSDSSAIMGYLKQYDSLLIIKEDNGQDATIFQRIAEINSSGVVTFPLKQGVAGVGAISKYAIGTLRDDALFLAREGVFSVSLNYGVRQERTAQDRSFYVNPKLTKEANLDDAVSVSWNGYFIVCVNSHCYVADSRQKSNKSSTEGYGYEWYYWDNVPATVFWEHEGSLYFGDISGNLCKFNTDVDRMSRYTDNDLAIDIIMALKADNDGDPMSYKTLPKKGSGVMVKPFTRSSVDIYVRTQKDFGTNVKTETMDSFGFDDIDFDRFTFNTMDGAQTIPINSKVKKYITLQFILKNSEINEGFGVFGIIKRYTKGNYVKRWDNGSQ